MAPEFPLARSLHTLVWNIKHYQLLHKRPPFKATRHPFCTNIQLKNASCTFWLKEKSKDFCTKLSKQIGSGSGSTITQGSPTSSKLLSNSSGALINASITGGSDNDDKAEKLNVHPAELEIVALFKSGDYSGMYDLIRKYKAEGTIISKEIINEIISNVHDDLPTDSTNEYLYQSVIEVPLFYGTNQLRYHTLYARVYPNIEHLYNICKLYESEHGHNKKFVENFIWLCYHMNDLTTLQLLLLTYLKLPDYDSRTLAYVLNAFVYNYDVEFSLSLFHSIVAMNKPLSESLLASTLIAFTKVDAIFDKSLDILDVWVKSANCEPAYPKTVAFLLKQNYRFGTRSEISSMEKLADEYGYNNNFLIRMVKSQAAISNRSFDRKKTITAEDIQDILNIRNSISHSKYALKIFYESYLHFLSKYSSLQFLQLILREMKKDELPFTKFAYDTVVQHYAAEKKFLPLVKFVLKFVSKANRFEPTYVKHIFDCYVATYPYQAEEFASQFTQWVHALKMLEEYKKSVLNSCKLIKLSSAITPVVVQKRDIENNKKYDGCRWQSISYQPQKLSRKLQNKEQVQFRLDNGIADLLKRGIRPDYFVIESTLRNLNATGRANLMKGLPDIRMEKYKTRLEIFDLLQSQPSKSKLENFVINMEQNLNTSDKLLLARRLFNQNSFEIAKSLLDTVHKDEMTDTRHMLKLNLFLRTNMARNDYESCIVDIREFPIDDITLSPYIYKQCQFIEKNLKRKIRALEANDTSPLRDKLEIMKETLSQLKGLLGDIEIRIEQDKKDLKHMVKQLFETLDKWIESTKNHDERKI